MIRQEDVFKIGRLGKPHGVRGELTFQFTDDVFDRVDADYLVLDVEGILVPFYFEEYRFRSDEVALVKFCDVDTEDRARELTGCDVFFPRALADDDADAPLTFAQLIGFTVLEAPAEAPSSPAEAPVPVEAPFAAVEASHRSAAFHAAAPVGVITAVDDQTLNVLFTVRRPDGTEVLLPASDDLILAVDRDARTITLRIPAGLLDL